jgi:hypothetical protein
MKIKTDLEFGQVWYIKDDPDQYPHRLVRVIIDPPMQFKFRLSYLGDIVEVFDFECSLEPDTSKTLNYEEKDED